MADFDETPDIQEEATRRYTMNGNKGIIKEGELMKQGGKVKNWKKRWFALIDTSITYFDQQGGKIKGGILMESVTEVRASTEAETKKSHCFTIDTNTGRAYIQQAPTKESMDEWISAVGTVLASRAPVSGTGKEADDKDAENKPASLPQVTVHDAAPSESKSKAAKYTIHYWPGFYGRTAGMTFLLEDVGADYEIVRDAKEFIYGGGNTGYPAFAVPTLVHGDHVVAQSEAILLYLGEKLGKLPVDLGTKCNCMQMLLNASDMATEIREARESIATRDKFLQDRFPKWVVVLEKSLTASEGPYLFGSEPTVADYQLLNVFVVGPHMLEIPSMPKLQPSLQAWYDTMCARPKIKHLFEVNELLPKFWIGLKNNEIPGSKLQNCKLSYFDVPGRGQPLRILMAIGEVDFEDNRIAFQEWGALKPTTPWGSLPTLELADGTVLAQWRAIMRFVGKEIGLYPADNVAAERCDEVLDFMDDITVTVNGVGKGAEAKQKETMRLEACTNHDGIVATLLARIDKFIEAQGGEGHAVGTQLTVADVAVYHTASNLICGFWDGVPPTLMDKYPNIQGVRKTVCAHPRVQAFFAQEGRGTGLEITYKTA